MNKSIDILYLHHSTGKVIWDGGVPQGLAEYNAGHGTNYRITEQAFPKKEPYGWNNYPYDYWNIWVNHAGPQPFMGEPTLEILTRQYQVIVWKHCFPVSGMEPDSGRPDIASPAKRMENYQLQYQALKKKMHEFPRTKFIVWTGAALTSGDTDEGEAKRARDFFRWVKEEWDEPGDNIFRWDFHQLETEGGLYLKAEYAVAADDSHPHPAFARKAASLFVRRLTEVIEGRGDGGR
jgi:hypothetical protein